MDITSQDSQNSSFAFSPNHDEKNSQIHNSSSSDSCEMHESNIDTEENNKSNVVEKSSGGAGSDQDLKNIVIKDEFVEPHMLEMAAAHTQTVLGKRRRTVLSIAEKVDLIRRMHEGESQKQLALEYGIGTSTVSDLKKHEVKILKLVEDGDLLANNRKNNIDSRTIYADVDQAVMEWLFKEVSKGREISVSEVMARACAEHINLRGSSEFVATPGWVKRFKRRYNIRAFNPLDQSKWRRPAFGDSKRSRGKHRRLSQTVSNNGDNLIVNKSVFENAEEREFMEYNRDEETCVDDKNILQPAVRLQEGYFGLNIPPVEEIPSPREVAIHLSKALVWAAAQQDTTAQELFVIKELQTRAIMRSTGKN